MYAAGNEKLLNISSGIISQFPTIVSAIGENAFAPAIAGFVNRLCDVDHCLAFRFADAGPEIIFSASLDGSDMARQLTFRYVTDRYWKEDGGMTETFQGVARSGVAINRLDVQKVSGRNYLAQLFRKPSIRERIIFSADFGDRPIALCLLRSEKMGLADAQSLAALSTLADIIFPVIDKHIDVTGLRSRFHSSLTSVTEIEMVMAQSSVGFTARERQVCARVLLSVSTAGIAAELGIGEETVATHRKKAYNRLSISNKNELMRWLLKECSQVGCEESVQTPTLMAPRMDRNIYTH